MCMALKITQKTVFMNSNYNNVKQNIDSLLLQQLQQQRQQQQQASFTLSGIHNFIDILICNVS